MRLSMLAACVLVGAACSDQGRMHEGLLPVPDGGKHGQSDDGTSSGSGGSGAHSGMSSGSGGHDAHNSLDAGTDAAPARISLPTYDAFCQHMAEQICSVLVDCCDVADLDAALCARYERNTYFMQHQAGCGPNGSEPESYDRESAETCFDLTRDSYAGCRLERRDAPGELERERACANVAKLGLPGPGDTCFGATDCSSSSGTYSLCEYGTDGQPDLCSDPIDRARAGEACASTPCQEDLACVLLATSEQPVCGNPQSDGAPCRDDLGCASGACTLDPDIGLGKCASERPEIEAATCAELNGLAKHALYAENAGYLYVNARDLVWFQAPQFFRAPKDGSGPVVAQPLPPGALSFAIDDENAYALNTLQQLLVIDLETGASDAIDLGFIAGDFAVGDDSIYVADVDCAGLTRIAKKDHAITRSTAQLPEAPETPASPIALLETDGEAVYCANRFALLRYTIDSSADAELLGTMRDSDTDFFFTRLIVGRDRIWLDAQALDGRSHLLQSDKTAGALVASTDVLAGDPNGVLDRARNRWITATNDGIASYSIADGTMELLPAQPIAVGARLALDDDFIYWTYRAATLRIAQ